MQLTRRNIEACENVIRTENRRHQAPPTGHEPSTMVAERYSAQAQYATSLSTDTSMELTGVHKSSTEWSDGISGSHTSYKLSTANKDGRAKPDAPGGIHKNQHKMNPDAKKSAPPPPGGISSAEMLAKDKTAAMHPTPKETVPSPTEPFANIHRESTPNFTFHEPREPTHSPQRNRVAFGAALTKTTSEPMLQEPMGATEEDSPLPSYHTTQDQEMAERKSRRSEDRSSTSWLGRSVVSSRRLTIPKLNSPTSSLTPWNP